MGFSKKSRSPEIEIQVNHAWYPGQPFTFYLPKKMPKSALDAESRFLGLKEDARVDEHRLALIETVSELVTREPEGFSDFLKDERPLAERFREYFDSPDDPELESILISVWRAYRASQVPNAYLKSRENNDERDNLLSSVSQ
ncbi:MAG: hypothetical protein WCF57_20270 [Pyrinomonadaceae bacterium]